MEPVMTTFIAYDFEIKGLADTIHAVAEESEEVRWRRMNQGDIWSDVVASGLRASDRLVAYVDKANANVGFEIGFALGLGKQVALVLYVFTLPNWRNLPPLNGMACELAYKVKELSERINSESQWLQISKPPDNGTGVLFLCPTETGDAYLRYRNPSWKTLPIHGWSIKHLPNQLNGIKTVIWIIPPHHNYKEGRDGRENAALSVVAGYAASLDGVSVHVLRHSEARDLADVTVQIRAFENANELKLLLAEITDRRPPAVDTFAAYAHTTEDPKVERLAKLPDQHAVPVIARPAVLDTPSSSPVRRRTLSKRALMIGALLFIAVVGLAGILSRIFSRSPNFAETIDLTVHQINPGKYMMGSPDSEPGRIDKGEEQQEVTMPKTFYMATTTVTQAQWRAVMGSNPSHFKGDLRPVERVSWDDAVRFCKKLSELDHRPYRLPLPEEWEYACRAGTTTAYYTGETINANQANFDDGPSKFETVKVGSFPPNPWGLYDMLGNVGQWCAHGSRESLSHSMDPVEPGEKLCVRGGSFARNSLHCRGAESDWRPPDSRSDQIGFRVVRDVP